MERQAVKKICVIPYCHTDYAWTNLREWHLARYIANCRETLDLMEAHPEYRAVWDNYIHFLQPVLRWAPELKERIGAAIRRGQLELARGGWSLARPSQTEEETWVRNMLAGNRKFEELFGPEAASEVVFNADTSMGHSQLPQLVRQLGCRYYQFQRPETNLNGRGVPKQFLWRGLDGSEITCARGFYGGFSEAEYLRPGREAPAEEQCAEYEKRELADRLVNAASATVQQFQGIDDALPLTERSDEPINVFGFIEAWNTHRASEMRFATLTESFHDVERDALPRLTGCVDVHDVSYNQPSRGENGLWRLRTVFGEALLQLEAARALAAENGLTPVVTREETDRLWESLFSVTGHAMEAILDADHERVVAAARGELARTKELTLTQAEEIAVRVGGGDESFLVLNPHSFAAELPVRLTVTGARGAQNFRLTDEAGQPVEHQIVAVNAGDKRYYEYGYSSVDVLARVSVKPMSAARVRIRREKGAIGPIEKRGLLLHKTDLPHPAVGERTFTVGGKELRLVKGLLYDARDPETPLAIPVWQETENRSDWLPGAPTGAESLFVPERTLAECEGEVLKQYRVYGTLGTNRAELVYRFGSVPGGVELETVVEHTAGTGKYLLRFAADAETPIAADVPFGWETKPAEELAHTVTDEYELTLRGQYLAKSWSRFVRKGKATTAVSIDCGCYWLKNSIGAVDLVLTRTCDREAVVYGSLDTWMDRTNDPSGRGRSVFRAALLTDGAPEAEASERALLLRRPPVAVACRGGGGAAPAEAPFVREAGPGILLTSFCREGGETVCRFWVCGEGGTLALRMRQDVRKAYAADLNGANRRELPLTGCRAELPVREFEIVTLRLVR